MYKIAVLPGDGIGPDVLNEGLKVIKAAAEKTGFDYETVDYDFGADRYAAEGCDCDGCDDCRSNKVVEEKDHCECDHAARGCCCDGCKDCRHNHSQLKAS